MTRKYRLHGPVFEAALSIGFAFSAKNDPADAFHYMIGIGKDTIISFREISPPIDVLAMESQVNAGQDDLSPWTVGLRWHIPLPNEKFFSFGTPDMDAVKAEMARLKEVRQVAKAALDPKTPKRTMKTRTDTV